MSVIQSLVNETAFFFSYRIEVKDLAFQARGSLRPTHALNKPRIRLFGRRDDEDCTFFAVRSTRHEPIRTQISWIWMKMNWGFKGEQSPVGELHCEEMFA